MKFATYLFCRILRSVLVLVTLPLWLPICFVGVLMYRAFNDAYDWYVEIRKDWQAREDRS